MKRETIYCLTDPQTFEVKYVGRTTKDPAVRLKQHLSANNKGNGGLQHWINSLKKINKKPTINILEVVIPCHASQAEKKWLMYYDKKGIYLLNLIHF